jgi:uncharacterized protein (DUF1499 family)
MQTLAVVLGVLLVAGAAGYLLLEKRPGYGAWYGIAKLTGSRLAIGRVDWATLRRSPTPNDALICPPAVCPNANADADAKVYPVTPAELLANIKRVALAEPLTSELECDPDCDRVARILQLTWLMRYPDTADIEVFAAPGGATLAIYSRSLVGGSDFGVNRKRIERWLAALERG